MAQNNSENKPPKVGLVLSGGGAKGLAHIGALKVIEEAGVKIDYIGGTSMGAIVGALYASGYSAQQLDSIFRSTDFTKLIQDDVPRNAKHFMKKTILNDMHFLSPSIILRLLFLRLFPGVKIFIIYRSNFFSRKRCAGFQQVANAILMCGHKRGNWRGGFIG